MNICIVQSGLKSCIGASLNESFTHLIVGVLPSSDINDTTGLPSQPVLPTFRSASRLRRIRTGIIIDIPIMEFLDSRAIHRSLQACRTIISKSQNLNRIL